MFLPQRKCFYLNKIIVICFKFEILLPFTFLALLKKKFLYALFQFLLMHAKSIFHSCGANFFLKETIDDFLLSVEVAFTKDLL